MKATYTSFSVLLHGVILLLLIGFNSTQTIKIPPELDDNTVIMDAQMVFASPAVSRPKKIASPVPAPAPAPKKIAEPPVPKKIAEPEPEPEPKSEPILQVNKTVAIKKEPPPAKPDKKRENDLKKMAEKSLEQAFRQETEQALQQEALQKQLRESNIVEQQEQLAASVQSEIAQYMRVISNKVTQNWRKPIEIKTRGMACLVLITTRANGQVAEVRVIQSSGDVSFDRSAEIAVRKSSPLPIPNTELARAQFKQFEFSFRPEA